MQSEIGYYFFAFLNRKEALVYSFVSFVQISLPLLQTHDSEFKILRARSWYL